MKRSAAAATSICIVAVFCSACISVDLPFGQLGPLEEATVYGEGDAKIAMIDVSGPLTMTEASNAFGWGGAESLPARVREQLEIAREDSDVVALLLRIDSPGGTVTASQVLHNEVMRWKRETGRPVIAQMMGMAASGGYFLAMAADSVHAYPSTVTGSIGVIFTDLNLSSLMDKIGVADETLTSGPYKDAGSPFRPVRPEEREQLQTVLVDMYELFLDAVDAGRPKLDRETLRTLADGRIYSARQALAAGLIDSVGDLPQAVEAARTAARISGPARVVVYHRPGREPENLFSVRAPATALRATPLSKPASLRGFLYLWDPGFGMRLP